jgi:hypothetical protein
MVPKWAVLMDLRLPPPHRNPHLLQLIEYRPGSGGPSACPTGPSEGVKAP